VELPSLDLNLVVVLHALLQERNVTRAGERVGLSQPGTSAALARLRRHFNDPLLERVGSQYVLTPLAQGLYDQVGRTLEDLRRVLTAQPHFDPAVAERRFLVRCSDAVLTGFGPRLVAAVTRAAPRVSLDFRGFDQTVLDEPLNALRDLDVLVVPRGLFTLPEAPSVELYRDRFVCLAWRHNRAVGERLTREDATHARWVMPFSRHTPSSPTDAALAALGIDRTCAVRVENFAMLGQLVVGTDLLVLCLERIARQLPHDELRELQMPFSLPPITETAWWHPSRQLDPGHRWFVELLQREAAEFDGAGRAPDGTPTSNGRVAEQVPDRHLPHLGDEGVVVDR
jgi:DNA-binding transcriptional LysR family regulator